MRDEMAVRTWFPVTLIVVAVCLLSAASASAKDVIHTAEEPLPPGEAAATMQVPEGFRVTLFAGEPDVKQPIGFCIDDRGRLWVAEAYNYPNHGDTPGDRIVILEDSDGDGRMDRRTVFYDQLNYVTGIEVGFGGVWVMSPPCMYFIPDRDGDDVPDEKPQVLLDGFGNHANAHNLANGFAWGPDGWLYGTHGRTNWSLIGKPGTPDDGRVRYDGGVYRYHPTRHVWEPYADGTTNPWGIDWNDYGDAFVCNCVNPHLFQVIQGAHYEPWRGRASSEFAYQRIDTIADHLHYVGLANVRNGIGSQDEDQAGGGHAHCGTMIYLGDNFPTQYRNQLFTNNIHGRRINNDLLRRSGSGYVASHGPDLMRSQDPWFMGVTLAYGPGGEVYASDWSDTGECHSTRNTRKHTGRIYRITYLDAHTNPVDFSVMSARQWVDLQSHENDWYVRHARRLLQQRAAAGKSMSQVHASLRSMLDREESVPKKLRAMWALWVTGGLPKENLLPLMASPHEEIRAWSVTLWCEDRRPDPAVIEPLVKMAAEDPSPRVRLSLASAMQRITPKNRWPLAEALAMRSEDTSDQNLPLMYWYGIEPLIDDDLDRFARMAARAAIPRVRVNAARRIASQGDSRPGLELLSRGLAKTSNASAAADVLAGMLQGLEGRRQVPMPASWRDAYERWQSSDNAEAAERSVRLALLFSDRKAIESLRVVAGDESAPPDRRHRAIAALVASREQGFGENLLQLLADDAVREAAIRGLAQYQVEKTAESLIGRYDGLSDSQKQAAIATLASREIWADDLLRAVEANQIRKADLTAFNARQLRAIGNDAITAQLQSVWGEVRDTAGDRAKQIADIKRWLDADVIVDADLGQGKTLFTKHCATCHRFFGEGGKVGPDITGAQRTNLDYLLENIVDPSASVSHDYRMHTIVSDDGRVITGLVESETQRTLTMLTAQDRIVIPMDEIEHRQVADVSIMPVGLLENLSEQEIRDLFGYLQRRQ
jgi:putative membrane-bound dehydrogenase-like protein